MRLSPLQSRLAVSLLASCLLVGLYLVLFTPRFALAAEVQTQALPIYPDDGSSGDVDVDVSISPDHAPLLDSRGGSLDPTYEPEFAAFDRSIIGRAPAGVSALTNNVATSLNGIAGVSQLFVFSPPSSVVSRREATDGAAGVESRGEQQQQHNGSRDQNQNQNQELEVGEQDGGDRPLARRQTGNQTVYISANTCLQPHAINASQTTSPPPQLTLYVSTTASNQVPGPDADTNTQDVVPFVEGAVMYNTTTSPGASIYLGIYSPNSTTSYTGIYNFEIAASVDGWYYSYGAQSDADLIWVDSDSQGALLITQDLSSSLGGSSGGNMTANVSMTANSTSSSSSSAGPGPYVVFAQNQGSAASIAGLTNSYCGLSKNAQIAGTSNGQLTDLVTSGVTTRGPGDFPKQQFMFSGLNASSAYLGVLAMDGNSSTNGTGTSGSSTRRRDRVGVMGGGGHVLKAINFTTQSGQGNCALISELRFCDQVAYSVPYNPINPAQANLTNTTVLAQWYDDYAYSQYQFFLNALAQIQCEAASDQAYSLVRNCSSCEQAYKAWLCTVTIPKCEDFSSNASYLQPRAVFSPFPDGTSLNASVLANSAFPNNTAFNASRNPNIDQFVNPGPYKELLPCDDLCYELVQSCPASLGFGCPTPGTIGYNSSYAQRLVNDGNLICNYQGSVHSDLDSGAAPVSSSVLVAGAVAGMAVLAILF